MRESIRQHTGFAWLAPCLLLSLAFAWAGCSSAPATDGEEAVATDADAIELQDSDLIPVADSPRRGAEGAWVTVVVFADFECPFCARLAATLDEVEESFEPGVMRVVFKHFPLADSAEPSPAARAGEAARMQGAFWEMHDALFDEFAQLSGDEAESVVLEIAASLGLDEEQFQRDMNSDAVRSRIERDKVLAQELEISGVPAVFVNGGFIAGAQAPEVYQTAIANVHHILQRGVAADEMQRDEVYRRSVETLYAHTHPGSQPGDGAPPVVEIPVHDQRPETKPSEEGLVQVGTFVSFSDDPSLQFQRQLDAIDAVDEAVRITYFHLLHDDDEPTRLAHRAVEGADSPEQVRRLVQWLSDEANDWRSDISILEEFLDQEGISAIADEDFDAIVAADVETAQQFDVIGTPTSFINGIRLVGAPEVGELRAIVEEQLALSERIADIKGLSGQALYEEMVQGNQQRKGEHL